jgi:hypothetical protein
VSADTASKHNFLTLKEFLMGLCNLSTKLFS